MKKILFNPFEKFDAKPLLFFGLIATVVGSVMGYLFNARFDGILDLHFTYDVKYVEPFTDNVFNIAVLFITLYVIGRSINPKVRPIDILVTAMIARLPLYLVCLTNIGGKLFQQTEAMLQLGPDELLSNPGDFVFVSIMGLLMIPFLVWYIAVLYNGFKVAVNVKTTKHKLLFALAIVVAEILSKILFYILY